MKKSIAARNCNVKKRTLVCQNSQFNVFFDHLEERGGYSATDYLVIAPKRKIANLVTGAAVLPIIDGKYALLKIYRHAIGGYSWEIPKGFIEASETAVESVKRELEEETGLRCKKRDIHSLGVVTPDAGIIAARVRLFVATNCSVGKPFIKNEMGHKALKFFNKYQMRIAVVRSVIQDPYTLIAYYRYTTKNKIEPR